MRKMLYLVAALVLAFAVWFAFSEFQPICRGHYDSMDGRPTGCDFGYFSPWEARVRVIGLGLGVSAVLVLIGRRFSRP